MLNSKLEWLMNQMITSKMQICWLETQLQTIELLRRLLIMRLFSKDIKTIYWFLIKKDLRKVIGLE